MSSVAYRAYSATWGRLFASLYDRLIADSEEAAMREHRAALLSRAAGRTLEIGAGTGLNLEHYPDGVTELVLTEPFEPMAKQLRERASGSERTTVVETSAASLPLDDDSFDTVVATFVLCSVDDVPAALGELTRVLRPGGELLFAEHVRASDPGLARWQDRLERPWKLAAHGCRCNRDTIASIGATSLELGEVSRFRLPKAYPIVAPMAVGSATKPA